MYARSLHYSIQSDDKSCDESLKICEPIDFSPHQTDGGKLNISNNGSGF